MTATLSPRAPSRAADPTLVEFLMSHHAYDPDTAEITAARHPERVRAAVRVAADAPTDRDLTRRVLRAEMAAVESKDARGFKEDAIRYRMPTDVVDMVDVVAALREAGYVVVVKSVADDPTLLRVLAAPADAVVPATAKRALTYEDVFGDDADRAHEMAVTEGGA